MNQAIDHQAVLLKQENDSLWRFIKIVMPFLEKNGDYMEDCYNKPFNHALHDQIRNVLRQKKHDQEMEDYMNKLKGETK